MKITTPPRSFHQYHNTTTRQTCSQRSPSPSPSYPFVGHYGHRGCYARLCWWCISTVHGTKVSFRTHECSPGLLLCIQKIGTSVVSIILKIRWNGLHGSRDSETCTRDVNTLKVPSQLGSSVLLTEDRQISKRTESPALSDFGQFVHLAPLSVRIHSLFVLDILSKASDVISRNESPSMTFRGLASIFLDLGRKASPTAHSLFA